MSIIVAVRKNEEIVVAADTLTCFGDDQVVPASNSPTRKIRRIGSSVIGVAGWGLYQSILMDHVATAGPPVLDDEASIFRFFMDFWKILHDKYPFVNDQAAGKDTAFGDLDSTFMIVNAGGIFRVSADMDVSRFNQFDAIGSGAEYALGAMHVSYDQTHDAAGIAQRGVDAACAYDTHCGAATEIIRIGGTDG